MTTPGAGDPGPGRSLTGPRIVAAALLAVGVAALLATFAISEKSGGLSVSGPRFMPLVVSIVLIALSVAFLVRTTIAPDEELARLAAAEETVTHWPTPSLLLGLLVVYVLLLGPLGYVVATVIFFPVAARVLGSERPVRDVAVGAVLAIGLYYAFTQFLGVPLPAGVYPL
ncbi:MAG TPA: tripartite tricarboxylate transporter TctB family protein [Solirubrobacteraceae bacterium]|nr:tripartite tricarboxylate transporter TctB family protein [Solirubrobacteraceae bacterium]